MERKPCDDAGGLGSASLSSSTSGVLGKEYDSETSGNLVPFEVLKVDHWGSSLTVWPGLLVS